MDRLDLTQTYKTLLKQLDPTRVMYRFLYLRALSLYSKFDGSRQGVFWLAGGNKNKKKNLLICLRRGKKTLQLQHVGGKKKVEQKSSKIDSTDHVFYSYDSVFACYVTCNNLQFIELTFSSPFLGIFYFNLGILVSISLPSFTVPCSVPCRRK